MCLHLLLLLTISCNAQLLNNKLLINPKFQSVNSFTGNILSSVLGAMSDGPIAAAKFLGLSGSIPTLIDTDNILNAEEIIGDFNAGTVNEDTKLHITELITKYGYPVEKHSIQTCDGYMLTLHRIPGNGSVVFLMHGLLGSSDDYVIAGPGKGLAYLFSENGYDVWLGNARGNKHSREHRMYTATDATFWDFSWHEIGYYDLPAMIDYVLFETDRSKLCYIGHSQGTTAFFVMASTLPEYNAKISIMVALSPVAWMSNIVSPLVKLMAPGGSLLHAAAKAIGLHEFLPDNGLSKLLRTAMCNVGPLSDILCTNILFLMTGYDFDQLNVTNLPVLFGHVPSGSSVKQFAHYGQGIITEDFRQFDYGTLKNLQVYGEKVPPSYVVERITAPVSLVYSESGADWLAHPLDVNRLYSKLGNAIEIYAVPFKNFNHVDYLWAKDVKTLIFNRVEMLLRRFY